MFPETDARASLNRLEQLRRAVGLESSGGAGPDSGAGVTVSVGVAAWPDDAADAIVLMTVAEQRLHEARAAGHDRLVGPG
jgi:GGDEF domain-containing protein